MIMDVQKDNSGLIWFIWCEKFNKALKRISHETLEFRHLQKK
jgi:hypothetical protein